MALTKTAVAVLASTSVAAGSTKASPGATGSSINCSTYYGGELTYKITNGASAPTVPATVMFQSSHNGTNWYDYQVMAGDNVASSVVSGSLLLDSGVMYIRLIAYGNTTNAVTVEANLQAVTGL
jgi:hypothetical protein